MPDYNTSPLSAPRQVETMELAAERLRTLLTRTDGIIGFIGNLEYAMQGLRSDQRPKDGATPSTVRPVEGQLSTIHLLIGELESRLQLLDLMASNAAARI